MARGFEKSPVSGSRDTATVTRLRRRKRSSSCSSCLQCRARETPSRASPADIVPLATSVATCSRCGVLLPRKGLHPVLRRVSLCTSKHASRGSRSSRSRSNPTLTQAGRQAHRPHHVASQTSAVGWSRGKRRALLSAACRGKTSSGKSCRTPRHAPRCLLLRPTRAEVRHPRQDTLGVFCSTLRGSDLCEQLSPGGQHHQLAYRSRLAAERCRNRRHRRTGARQTISLSLLSRSLVNLLFLFNDNENDHSFNRLSLYAQRTLALNTVCMDPSRFMVLAKCSHHARKNYRKTCAALVPVGIKRPVPALMEKRCPSLTLKSVAGALFAMLLAVVWS